MNGHGFSSASSAIYIAIINEIKIKQRLNIGTRRWEYEKIIFNRWNDGCW